MTQHIDNTRGTSSPKKKDNNTLIFVYGSLRKGMGLNPVLDSSEHIGLAFTMPKYTMYDLGAFPCLTDNGKTLIVGDLYSVDSDTLLQLDVIEGVPNLYQRKEIEIQSYGDINNVQAYFWANDDITLDDEFKIANGDWLAHRGVIKYNRSEATNE